MNGVECTCDIGFEDIEEYYISYTVIYVNSVEKETIRMHSQERKIKIDICVDKQDQPLHTLFIKQRGSKSGRNSPVSHLCTICVHCSSFMCTFYNGCYEKEACGVETHTNWQLEDNL